MPKNLIENLNSDYLEALSALSSKKSPKKILVYVESDDDISFWRSILNGYQSNNTIFEINLPNKDHYEKGKKNLLKNFKDNLGPFLIICVDSDYDYLLLDRDEDSKLINNNSFIFQTYSYSIENLLCYSDTLNRLCVDCTKVDNINFEIKYIINQYSEIIYDLLIWSIYFYKINEPEKLSITTFCETSKLLTNNDIDNHFKDDLDLLRDKVSKKLNEINKLYKNHIENRNLFAEELKKYGVNKSNCYLFAQGHLVLENFILMILKPICQKLKSQKIESIKQNCKHAEHIGNEINSYKKKLIDVEKAILINYKFHDSELYNKIKLDIETYILKYN